MRRSWRWPAAICLAYAAWAWFEHGLNWSLTTDRRLVVGLAIAIATQGLVAFARERGPAAAAGSTLGWSVVLGIALVGLWASPSPLRDAFCSAPEAICEHGMLLYVFPVLTAMLGVVAALLAAAASWLRQRLGNGHVRHAPDGFASGSTTRRHN